MKVLTDGVNIKDEIISSKPKGHWAILHFKVKIF